MYAAFKLYLVHVMIRKSLGEMTRKLSATESRNASQFRGTFSRRKPTLTPHQRLEALARLKKGEESARDLARTYNVSRATISRLRP
jgi:hypothetical protein